MKINLFKNIKKRNVKYEIQTCKACGGSGYTFLGHNRCRVCSGSGKLIITKQSDSD